MIFFVAVNLQEIFDQGKSYKWIKPDTCPNCQTKNCLWGHGCVLAFFDTFLEGIYLRRYRCPCCGCVIRMKPKGYFKGFQAPVETILNDISHRVKTGHWPPGSSGPRRRHWMKALLHNIRLYLGEHFCKPIEGFTKLLNMGRIPVQRSK